MQQTIFIGLNAGGNPAPFTVLDQSRKADTVKANIGDEISFDSSPRGMTVEVDFFEGKSPFQEGTMVKDKTFHRVSKQGTFHYKCTLVTADGIRHGWPDNPNDGGTVEVGSGH